MSENNHKNMSEENHWNHTDDEDRRKGERRTGQDQRDMIRFEPDKTDRRSGKDRRREGNAWSGKKPI